MTRLDSDESSDNFDIPANDTPTNRLNSRAAVELVDLTDEVATPSTGKKRPICWEFFEYPALDSQIRKDAKAKLKVFIQCKICSERLRYFPQTTSNLDLHASKKHKAAYDKAAKDSQTEEQQRLGQVMKEKGISYFQKAMRVPFDQTATEELMTKWIIVFKV
jgi:hypothetical protein